jgi:guanylate kinase
MKNNLYIFLGGSGSGKTTLEKYMRDNGYANSLVSLTTREVRPGEEEGISYKFVSVEDFNKRNLANRIEITEDWLYGIEEKDLLTKNNLVYSVINIKPAYDLIQYIKTNKIDLNPVIIFFDIDKETRIQKIVKRGSDEADVRKRLSREDSIEDLNKFNLKAEFVFKNMDNTMSKKLEDFLCKSK